MIIAIDGPAGVGKSTVAQNIAEALNVFYVNSGSFYRSVSFIALEKGIDCNDDSAIIEVAKSIYYEIKNNILLVNGRNISEQLRTDSVDSWVAKHSSISEVRDLITKKLRTLSERTSLLMEGRDIGTVVFPNADYKFFLDATPEVRAKRRFLQGTSEQSLDELVKSIEERDKIDRTKKIGALKAADDAIQIDTSDLTIDQVCEKVKVSIYGQINQQE